MDLVKSAELFAKNKHAGKFRVDGTIPYSKHLEDVVNRLKSLGVIDKELLCAGWLHDTIENTDTTFNDTLVDGWHVPQAYKTRFTLDLVFIQDRSIIILVNLRKYPFRIIR